MSDNKKEEERAAPLLFSKSARDLTREGKT